MSGSVEGPRNRLTAPRVPLAGPRAGGAPVPGAETGVADKGGRGDQ